jgi:hypothetical protein
MTPSAALRVVAPLALAAMLAALLPAGHHAIPLYPAACGSNTPPMAGACAEIGPLLTDIELETGRTVFTAAGPVDSPAQVWHVRNCIASSRTLILGDQTCCCTHFWNNECPGPTTPMPTQACHVIGTCVADEALSIMSCSPCSGKNCSPGSKVVQLQIRYRQPNGARPQVYFGIIDSSVASASPSHSWLSKRQSSGLVQCLTKSVAILRDHVYGIQLTILPQRSPMNPPSGVFLHGETENYRLWTDGVTVFLEPDADPAVAPATCN